MKKTIAAAAGLGIAAAMAIAAPSSADPKGEIVPLDCDNGVTYTVAVNGNGDFTPGHDVNSTSMLIPTSFGDFHGVVTDSTGEVIDEFTDPAMSKGSSTKPRRTSLSCTFTIVEQFEDPELGLLTFTGTGSVEGFLTPAH